MYQRYFFTEYLKERCGYRIKEDFWLERDSYDTCKKGEQIGASLSNCTNHSFFKSIFKREIRNELGGRLGASVG